MMFPITGQVSCGNHGSDIEKTAVTKTINCNYNSNVLFLHCNGMQA